MILPHGGLVLCHSDIVSQVVVVVAIPLDFLVWHRIHHPLYGKQCLAMQFARLFWHPLAVFLPLAPSMLLWHAKCMLRTYHIPCNDQHGCQSQHISNSNSTSVKHLSLLPSPTASSQPTLPCSIHHPSSIIHHQWQLPISSLLNPPHLNFPNIQ